LGEKVQEYGSRSKENKTNEPQTQNSSTKSSVENNFNMIVYPKKKRFFNYSCKQKKLHKSKFHPVHMFNICIGRDLNPIKQDFWLLIFGSENYHFTYLNMWRLP